MNPRGRTATPVGLKSIADRYSFTKAPRTFEEINFEKGVDFFSGKLGDINIDKLTLFVDGISIDTRSSSDDCDAVLTDLLAGVKQANGFEMQPSRRMRLSHVIFRSNLKLALMHSALQSIADRIAEAVSEDYRQEVHFEPSLIAIGADVSQIKLTPSLFTIDRRANTPFSENVYFSAAPLGTAAHLEVIQQFESIWVF